MMAKKSYDDADQDAIFLKTVTSHTNPSGGLTTVTIAPADTSSLEGVYVYDIQLNNPLGNIYIIAAGSLKIVDKVKA